jgi:hypothetical protein
MVAPKVGTATYTRLPGIRAGRVSGFELAGGGDRPTRCGEGSGADAHLPGIAVLADAQGVDVAAHVHEAVLDPHAASPRRGPPPSPQRCRPGRRARPRRRCGPRGRQLPRAPRPGPTHEGHAPLHDTETVCLDAGECRRGGSCSVTGASGRVMTLRLAHSGERRDTVPPPAPGSARTPIPSARPAPLAHRGRDEDIDLENSCPTRQCLCTGRGSSAKRVRRAGFGFSSRW